MIRGPSNQKKYTEYWSGDPAFIQQPTKAEYPDPAELEQAQKEYAEKLERARETGNWDELRLNGGPTPTGFVMRPMPGEAFREIVARLEDGGKAVKLAALAFRACITKIENGGHDEIKRERTASMGDIATVAVCNYLDSIDPNIVSELGLALIQRGTRGLSPKS